MKEADAKHKWCPMARVAEYSSGGVGGINRAKESYQLMPTVKCLGNECAVWVDDTPKGGHVKMPDGKDKYFKGGSIPLGHCGLIHK